MADIDLDRLERERQDADRKYNDALTAFDRSLVRSTATARPSVPAGAPLPDAPRGWRGRWLQAVRRWLGPWLEAQLRFNTQVAAAVETMAAREEERVAALERFQSALIAFLQQITAFVETKDRQLSATAATRLDEHQDALGTLPDLRGQVAVLQRAAHMLTRRMSELGAPQPAAALSISSATAKAPVGATASADDYKYVAFEDQFRGSVDEIRAKLGAYLPIFDGASNVLDVGCGRGEFLTLLRSAGIPARGVDVNSEMIAAARDRGLDAEVADAIAYLQSQGDESVGGIFAAQVVEHLEPSYLMRFLETAFHKLRPGAPIVLETINPACWLAFFSSYLRDPTHVRPIHPETLEYLARASGFARVSIRYSAPVADDTRMKQVDLPADILASSDPTARALVEAARVVNVNAGILNNLAFSYHDYAIIGYRS
jgi:2-polyprenyl-3-methyl-5-hydroxy-6-metoxy-1,4-benzoquinol methylase